MLLLEPCLGQNAGLSKDKNDMMTDDQFNNFMKGFTGALHDHDRLIRIETLLQAHVETDHKYRDDNTVSHTKLEQTASAAHKRIDSLHRIGFTAVAAAIVTIVVAVITIVSNHI